MTNVIALLVLVSFFGSPYVAAGSVTALSLPPV